MSLWRNSFIDFKDFKMFDFVEFQTIMTLTNVNESVTTALSPFDISPGFISVLSGGIYNYCYGKQINLKNTDRWSHNFSGEIKVFMLERARYLQAYDRDFKQDISIGDSSKSVTDYEGKSGTADTRKKGGVNDNQITNINGRDEQHGEKGKSSNLTTLRNQSTSTNYLGTQNEEAGTSGTVSQTGSMEFGKSDSATIDLSMENGASLSKDVNRQETNNTVTNSPLTIAKAESEFNFQEWFEPLFAIIDTYFIQGGTQYA